MLVCGEIEDPTMRASFPLHERLEGVVRVRSTRIVFVSTVVAPVLLGMVVFNSYRPGSGVASASGAELSASHEAEPSAGISEVPARAEQVASALQGVQVAEPVPQPVSHPRTVREISTASSNATMPSVQTEDVAPRQEAVASLMGGPALSVGEDTLEGALSCPESFTHLHDPVLLVHGVTQTSDETWAWNYAKVLPSRGFDVCTVDLPDFGRADAQVQTEYVVHAIKAVAERSGGAIDVVAHSLGALPARAAIKWWPELRGVVDDLVMVAGTNHGTVHAHWQCATACIPSLWQLKPDSRFLAALNAGDETPGDISYTSVYSRTDLAVQPQLPGNATSEVTGASNVAVEDLCAVRVVDHPQTVSDAAVSAGMMDALTHPGPADPARIDRAVCLQVAAPGIDLGDALAYELTWWRDLVLRSQEHKTGAEPAPAAWAVP